MPSLLVGDVPFFRPSADRSCVEFPCDMYEEHFLARRRHRHRTMGIRFGVGFFPPQSLYKSLCTGFFIFEYCVK
jgi:hypothetical protein